MWMSIPETEMSDSWDAPRRSVGRLWVVGENASSMSKSGEVSGSVSGVGVSSSSGITGCTEGESTNTSFESEFCGLIAEMMAVAGLDLVVKDIGDEELRIVDKFGGFKLLDLSLR